MIPAGMSAAIHIRMVHVTRGCAKTAEPRLDSGLQCIAVASRTSASRIHRKTISAGFDDRFTSFAHFSCPVKRPRRPHESFCVNLAECFRTNLSHFPSFSSPPLHQYASNNRGNAIPRQQTSLRRTACSSFSSRSLW